MRFSSETKSRTAKDKEKMGMVKGLHTWYYNVDGGSWIPLEAHRVTQQKVRLRLLVIEVCVAVLAVAKQCVDVVRQAQQLVIHFIFNLQLQEVAATPDPIHTFHHMKNTHQCEPPALTERINTTSSTVLQNSYNTRFQY